jgi:hypothetical protein
MSLVLTMRRSGLAMAGAMVAIVVVGAIVTGGFFYAAHAESRGIRNTTLKDAAESIADFGLAESIARLNATDLEGYELNAATTVANDVTVRNGNRAVGTYTVVVTRITPVKFVVKATGAASAPAAVATYTVSRTIRLPNV